MEGVKLISIDSDATDTILRASEERGLGRQSNSKRRISQRFYLAVVATQNYVLEQYHKQDLQFEKTFL